MKKGFLREAVFFNSALCDEFVKEFIEVITAEFMLSVKRGKKKVEKWKEYKNL